MKDYERQYCFDQAIERPFALQFSEHDLRHLRVALRDRAIQSTDWGKVRCAVGIYERINGQLTEEQKNLLAGPPQLQRDKRKLDDPETWKGISKEESQ